MKLVLWLVQKQDSPRSTGLSSCSFFKIAIICGVLGTVQRKTPHIYIYIITYFIGIILPTRNLHLYIPTVTPCISPIMDDCSGSKPIKRSIYLHYISRCFSQLYPQYPLVKHMHTWAPQILICYIPSGNSTCCGKSPSFICIYKSSMVHVSQLRHKLSGVNATTIVIDPPR